MLFLPSFFTVMVHLTVHLVDEVIQGGPVHYRWMYFVERVLGHFKSLIGSKSQAEGCIAGQKIEEALTLYSHYFEDIESRVNRPKRVNDETNHDEVPERSSMFPRQEMAKTKRWQNFQNSVQTQPTLSVQPNAQPTTSQSISSVQAKKQMTSSVQATSQPVQSTQAASQSISSNQAVSHSTSSSQAESQPNSFKKRVVGCESTEYWTVEAIDS
ncbi:uncharacterized protein [Solanum lycopersicum]|uniref:uncharacterized protein isoform X4 n=1 Tax=Solanum lycopersicum TaxID=4081 RepID=UPI003749B504